VSKRPGQPGGVRDRNRKEKEKVLLDAALPLFLARGVEGVSVDDITRAAGVAKGSFYRYFDDQEAMVATLVQPIREVVLSSLEEISRGLEKAGNREKQMEIYQKVGGALATLLMYHPGASRLYLQESRGPAVGARRPLTKLSQDTVEAAIKLTRKAQTLHIFRAFPAAVSALTVVGAAEKLILGVLLEQELGNPLEIPAALISLVFDGIAHRARRPG
jgi:AcrR family transcriptional regulator